MTPELGQRTSSTVGMLTVQCVCIFREVQWTILVLTARALEIIVVHLIFLISSHPSALCFRLTVVGYKYTMYM